LAVDEVFAFTGAIDAARDLHFGGVGGELAFAVVEGHCDFSRPRLRLEAEPLKMTSAISPPAQAFGRLFAENPADGIDDIALARAVRPDDGGDAVAELETVLSAKLLKPTSSRRLSMTFVRSPWSVVLGKKTGSRSCPLLLSRIGVEITRPYPALFSFASKVLGSAMPKLSSSLWTAIQVMIVNTFVRAIGVSNRFGRRFMFIDARARIACAGAPRKSKSMEDLVQLGEFYVASYVASLDHMILNFGFSNRAFKPRNVFTAWRSKT